MSASPLTPDERPLRPQRRPAVPIAVCFAAGIALDRWLAVPWETWLAAGAALAGAWMSLMLWGRPRRAPALDSEVAGRAGFERLAALLLLAACLCVGGARHHAAWFTAPDDDVSLFASEEPITVRLVGDVASQPWIRPRKEGGMQPSWPRFDTTTCLLECRRLVSQEGDIPVSGRARLSVNGHLLHAQVGDEVEVVAWMSLPRGPANPGEFDFRAWLRAQGIRTVLSAQHPDAVQVLRHGAEWRIGRKLAQWRDECDRLFAGHLSPEAAPVAAALILGNRSQMDPDVQTAFTESGMMHVLAISGLHVGILALFCAIVCRLLNLSPPMTAVVILAAVVGLAALSNARPPIVRAGVFVGVALVARLWFRRSPMENTLAVASLVVLGWNPTDLFDTGTQLSFLAVMGIILWQSHQSLPRGSAVEPEPERGPLARSVLHVAGGLKEGYGMTASIWLFAVPLVAARFHVVSPVGLLINVFLVPLVTLVLWIGYAFLFCGLLLPPAAPVFGAGFEFGLRLLLWLVEAAAGWKLGHLYAPGPPGWWLAGYYLLLMGTAVLSGWPPSGTRAARPPRPDRSLEARPGPKETPGPGPAPDAAPGARRTRWGWVAIGLWVVGGLAVDLVPARPEGLRCTFLAVGHGGAILVEAPNGRTLLYDVGAIDDPDRPARAVRSALWTRRLARIDAVVLSHADIDHFNGLPALLRAVPVGTLFVAPSFLDFGQPAVAELCDAARRHGVPIRLVWTDDRLRLDDRVTIEVLHPDAGWRAELDNANSIVLSVEFAGRRLLLTGDLERDGLDRFLALPPRETDVLLAPHHGSPVANPARLARWAEPRHVVVSGGRPQSLAALRQVYDADVLSTVERGAVTVEIRPDGMMRVTTVR